MIINMLLSWYRRRDLAQQGSRTEPLHGKDILCDMVAHQEEVKTKSKPLTVLANYLHLTTFLPLAIITILQDVDLGMAAVICVAEIIFFMLVGFVLYRTRYIKVFPKKYDVFNLQVRYFPAIVLPAMALHCRCKEFNQQSTGCKDTTIRLGSCSRSCSQLNEALNIM
jgi:hypothetical protein